MKQLAARAGVTVEALEDHVLRGRKWCYACDHWLPADDYGSDRGRYDGRSPTCKNCRNDRARKRYEPKARKQGQRFIPARNGDAKQARSRINYFVEVGLIPAPNDLPCTDCGHVYREGGKRHEYDHYNGYGAAHHEDVEAACSGCHYERERSRRNGNKD